MKRMLITMLAFGAASSTTLLPAASHAEEQIACASEVPAARKGQGHWYYRLIDGRKCWYDGKPMMPKTSLYWPDSSTAEKEQAARTPSDEETTASKQNIAKPSTDGRNVSAGSPVMQSATAEPAATQPAMAPPRPASPTLAQGTAWPPPSANEISFEQRWLGLHSKN
jgi:hypothetical protein